MKNTTLTLIAACLAATSGAALAQAAPAAKPEQRMATREELRACLVAEPTFAKRKQALLERNNQVKVEGEAIRTVSEELKSESERVSSAGGGLDRFNRKVRDHNLRIEAQRKAAEALNADTDQLRTDTLAWNAQCGGIQFKPEDKEAILKELGAK